MPRSTADGKVPASEPLARLVTDEEVQVLLAEMRMDNLWGMGQNGQRTLLGSKIWDAQW